MSAAEEALEKLETAKHLLAAYEALMRDFADVVVELCAERHPAGVRLLEAENKWLARTGEFVIGEETS